MVVTSFSVFNTGRRGTTVVKHGYKSRDAETEGNVSEMIPILLAEAITARQSTTRTSSKARTRVPTA